MTTKAPRGPLTVATVSLGCVKNIIDTEVFLGRIAEAGLLLTPDETDADIVLVNTCSFIEQATEESLDALRSLVAAGRERGRPRVVAVGCMVQRYGEKLFELVPGLAGAVGLDEERRLPELLTDIVGGARIFRTPGPSRAPARADTARLRITPAHYAYLRISEGCNAGCTFCVIPRIRGPLRSKSLATTLREARELVGSGARELILVAQDLTAYGRDRAGASELPRLLEELEAIPDLSWIRLLYLHPNHLTGELIDRIAESEKVLPCLDLPFQHASSRVLERMGRGMTTSDARRLVARLRAAIPPIVLRGTFLVGFPGESERDFATLNRFVEGVGFPRGGVFCWSPQEGTKAAGLPNRVPARETRTRMNRIRRLLTGNLRRFNRDRVGRTLTVVVDEERDGRLAARSFAEAPDADPVILLPLGSADVGTFHEVRITGVEGLDMVGEVVGPSAEW